jgi:D-alanyl-D-alanine carboxypeptidase
MTILGRQLFYDFPQYYNLFSRRQTDAGVRTVYNTNRKLLAAYKGADGIKTGYTSAAGFNLVASAERNGERIIATVFGGRSSNARNAKVAELLDLGFKRAPRQVAERPPRKPDYQNPGARSLPVLTVVRKSLRPKARPGTQNAPTDAPMLVAEMQDDIKEALRQAVASPTQPAPNQPAPEPQQIAQLIDTSLTPRARPQDLLPDQAAPDQPEVVSRVSTSGGRHWGINVGKYTSRHQAERILLKTALLEVDTLDGSLRRVVKQNSGYAANFLGLSQETADLACRRLQARKLSCTTIGPPPG